MAHVLIHRSRCHIWNLSCGIAHCLPLSLSLILLSLRWRFYNLSAIEIQQTFLNLFAWLHFGRAFCQRGIWRGRGALAAPSGHILHLPPTFIDCLVVVVPSLHLVRCLPMEQPAWHGTHCFDFYPQREYANWQSEAEAETGSGLAVTRRATSPQAPIVLAEFSQQRLATFLAKCFVFFGFFLASHRANQTCSNSSLLRAFS